MINSYAWDTAIVYIQEFSEDKDYSRQDGISINASLTNTGANLDELCKINDMASNTSEWTTEYSTYTDSTKGQPSTLRSGNYFNSNGYTSCRYYATVMDKYKGDTFRPILYI